MSLRLMDTLLPYLAQGSSTLPQGGQSLLPCSFQGDLNMYLKRMGTLLPYLAQGAQLCHKGARVVPFRGT